MRLLCVVGIMRIINGMRHKTRHYGEFYMVARRWRWCLSAVMVVALAAMPGCPSPQPVGAPTGGPQAWPQPTPEIHETLGQVTAVEREIIVIDAGWAHGVKADMRLVLHRDGRFLGYLLIAEVDEERSAGVVVDRIGDVQKGDKVSFEPKRAVQR